MATKRGSLSIDSENIFPIIKKWLYSDQDIFIRELISNGVDAITKLRKLVSLGEAEVPDGEKYKVTVLSSPKDKTLTFIDNGIGMTADEVDRYINQIAFSGAAEFLDKYKDKDESEQIIGHFGLGFYSAFMVADKVTIETLSYQKDAAPVLWECSGGTDFRMSEGSYGERGTKITLYLSEDCLKYANEWTVKEIIGKYCSFMPVEIYYINEDEAKTKADEIESEAKIKDDKRIDDEEADLVGDAPEEEPKDASDAGNAGEDEGEEDIEKKNDEPRPLNDIHPLWTKMPSECKDEEYKDFYQHVFYDFKEPLFWIHLNMDYPFNLKGILYFPRLNPNVDQLEGKVKLYNNQVFVADNIKEVIPEFLLVLKGIIDCPDLPLNVSRSALQNDGNVKKISEYITKKVADKLIGMFKNHKEDYEALWDDISSFIKFGCLRDNKFEEKMHDYMIFRNIEGKYITLPEYLEAAKEKHENTVYYISDENAQAKYIEMFRGESLDAIYLTHNIDSPYITSMEAANENVKFLRIDADVSGSFKGEALSEEDEKKYTEALTEIFKKATGKDKINIKVESLKDESISSIMTQDESERRMAEMMKMYSMQGFGGGSFGEGGETLVLNSNNKLVKYLIDKPEGENAQLIAEQLYDLAALANKPLSADDLTKFVTRSNTILGMIAENEK